MNEEEKEAIEILQGLCTDDCVNNDIVKTIVKLIEKQQKEIEELKDKIKEKIEERNKWLQEYDEQEEMNELQKDDYRLIKVERNILQSLLEKE